MVPTITMMFLAVFIGGIVVCAARMFQIHLRMVYLQGQIDGLKIAEEIIRRNEVKE